MRPIDKIVLFTAEHAAQLIDGRDTDSTLIVMKTLNQNALNVAVTWFNQGETSEPWPLAEPQSRGEHLVDFHTEEICQQILATTLEANRAKDAIHFRQQLLTSWAGGKDFARRQFHRDELARWIKDCGIESDYPFNQLASGAVHDVARQTSEASLRALEEVQEQTSRASEKDGNERWKLLAVERAKQFIGEAVAGGFEVNQERMAARIAEEFRKQGIVGASGKTLSGAYIKRHALKGIETGNAKLRAIARK